MLDRVDDIASAFSAALRPKAKVLPSVFAERAIVLGPATSRPGRLTLEPFQKQIVDLLADDSVNTIVIRSSSQIGKSLLQLAAIGYAACVDPGPTLVVQPSESHYRSWMNERLLPLLVASPELKQAFKLGGRGKQSSNFMPIIGGNFLAVASAWQQEQLAARAVRYVLADEVSRYPLSAGKEGSPLTLAARRSTTFRNRKLLITSTPGSTDDCVVTQQFLRGDQRYWQVECPHCHHWDYYRQDRFVIPDNEPTRAYIFCSECGAVTDNEAERLRQLRAGRWTATAKGEEGVASFQLNALQSPFNSMRDVARAVISAKTVEEQISTENTIWGLPSSRVAAQELIPSELRARARPVPDPLPERVQHITLGIDVQSNRVEGVALGNTKTRERFVLNYFVLMGDPLEDDVWNKLTEAARGTFRREDGAILPIGMIGVDCGFLPDRVFTWVRRMRALNYRCFPTKGQTRGKLDEALLREGQRHKGGLRPLLLGTTVAKYELLRSLNAAEGSDNYIHLPDHVPEQYFEHLSAERLVATYRKGYPTYQFELAAKNARNEGLDCTAIASAVATLVKTPVKPVNQPAAPTPSIKDIAARLHQSSNRSQPYV